MDNLILMFEGQGEDLYTWHYFIVEIFLIRTKKTWKGASTKNLREHQPKNNEGASTKNLSRLAGFAC